MTRVFRKLQEWKEFRQSGMVKDETLGFVPTMGALHRGHLSLIEKSRSENSRTLVSIFVNPTQFNDPSDFENYPQTWNADLTLLEAASVDFVLFPKADELYEGGYRYRVQENEYSQLLCGKFRPGHFDGVLTVVMKLLNLADANQAYFGEKDYQQGQLVQGMVNSFFMKTRIHLCPTVREEDGLAMSSRNTRLTPAQRLLAREFPRILKIAPSAEVGVGLLQDFGFEVDYFEEIQGRRYGAVRLGAVRLIDNQATGDKTQ